MRHKQLLAATAQLVVCVSAASRLVLVATEFTREHPPCPATFPSLAVLPPSPSRVPQTKAVKRFLASTARIGLGLHAGNQINTGSENRIHPSKGWFKSPVRFRESTSEDSRSRHTHKSVRVWAAPRPWPCSPVRLQPSCKNTRRVGCLFCVSLEHRHPAARACCRCRLRPLRWRCGP